MAGSSKSAAISEGTWRGVLGEGMRRGALKAYLGLCATTIRLGFSFVKVFFVGLDLHRENVLLEFLPFWYRNGRLSVVLGYGRVRDSSV